MASLPPNCGARPYRAATQLVHGGGIRSPFGETAEALYLTQGYVFDSMEACEARFKGDDPGFVYSRYGNPTVAMFEERMALLEGAEAARATATGMAAVTASLLSQVKAGDHVVAARALFGACRYIVEDLLPRFGVASTLIDGADLDAWRAARRPETRLFFLESPTNPCLDVYDVAAIAAIAHEIGALVVIDNVFATPILQKPLTLGADIVVYSATKHIDGGGRCLGGVILGSRELIEKDVQTFLRQTGPALSPFNAWVLLKAMETLSLRVARQSESAARIADMLVAHPHVTMVRYPGHADHPHAAIVKRQMAGGGTLVAFEIAGGKPSAFAFARGLRLIRISSNLGDAKSLITHPATTTHQRLAPQARLDLGVTEGLVRLSVGLEDVDDLIEDLASALSALDGLELAAE